MKKQDIPKSLVIYNQKTISIGSPPLRFKNTPEPFTSDSEPEFVDIDLVTPSQVTRGISPEALDHIVDNINAEEGGNATSIPLPTEMDQLITLKPQPDKCTIFKNASLSLLTGAGVGIGMMPIFNFYLKKSPLFGFDLHGNEIIFALSTANTFMIYGFNSSYAMYQFLSDNHQTINNLSNGKKLSIAAAKVGASCSVIFPIALLWHIEITNQKVSKSEGFDQFMAWASAATIPIFADKVLSSCNAVDYINSIQNTELNSLGGKVFTYGISLIGAVGRLASYSSIGYLLAQDMGLPSTEAMVLGITIAGLLGSGGENLFQYQKMKALFTENNTNLTVKKGLIGTIAILEGVWLSFPLVSVGLEAMQSVNATGVTAAVLAPMFVSNAITESQLSYNSINGASDWVAEKCCGLFGNTEDNYANVDA